MKTIKQLPRTDMRLGRIIEHDSMSLEYPFDVTGLSIIDVTHTRHIPILDQGQVGSCTANAGIGDISCDPFPQTKTFTEVDALKYYSDAEKIDGGVGYPPEDKGSSGLSIAKALNNAGLIAGYQHTFSLDSALKAGSKYPFITGTNWHANMFTPDADGRVHPTGAIEGGHEYVCRQIDATNKKIWFDNSWGDSWGIQGRFYMTFDDYGKLLKESGDVTILLPLGIFRTLKLGMNGPDVKALQINLTNAGYPCGTADGIFGKNTFTAVEKFQSANSLKADGIYGPKTDAILKSMHPNPQPTHLSLIDALIQVESGGNDQAMGDMNLPDHAYGCLQIRQPVITDVNKANGWNWKPQDMLGNRQLSITVFNAYIHLYEPLGNDEAKARLWNGGPNWRANKLSTDGYWNKVKQLL